ncbi:hypothetical protein ACFWM1_21565 [Nocardia sp. NPDC058379]|uniref:hypothetical protein n=1 Tax=unclassified Nocardia TaxID=2637762 RepID=UPI0036471806
MKIAGNFDEFWPTAESSLGPIRKFVASDNPPYDPKFLRYLDAGHILFAAVGATSDELGSEAQLPGGASILTDGEWVWRADLHFYAARYHVDLPNEFKDRVEKLNYEVPAVERDDLIRLTHQLKELRSSPTHPRTELDS